MRPLARRPLAALAVAFAALSGLVAGAALAPAQAATTYAQIVGDGSTWSENIVKQWARDVAKTYNIPVTYGGGGSSVGRKNFANYQDDFAISEIPFQGTDELGQSDTAGGRPYAYLPIVAGGTAFTYHLELKGQLMRDIRLSPETIAKIFTGVITSWADPQIRADNNGRAFPDTRIVPVVRSDGSGTTAQFTLFMDKRYPDIWHRCFPHGGLTSYYPRNCGDRTVAQNGSDQVMNYIKAASGNGTIGYIEYSYANNVNFPVVKVLNPAGNYVLPTQYNVAVALTKARIETQNKDPKVYLTQILDDVYTNADPRSYPLSSYSYMILPVGATDTRMTTQKRQTLVDFLFYGLCQGQGEAGPYGYSPMPLNLVQAGFDQIAKLKTADPNVQLQNRDATKCNNPTFDGSHLDRNKLAETAPMPSACDAQGKGPCLGVAVPGAAPAPGGGGTSTTSAPGGSTTGTGSSTGTTTGGGAAGGKSGTATGGGGGSGGKSGGASTGGAASGTGGKTTLDPVTGELVSADGSGGTDGGGDVGASVTTDIPVRSSGTPWLYAGITAAALLGVVLVPGVLGAWRRREEGDQ